jgi:hypothetical protein
MSILLSILKLIGKHLIAMFITEAFLKELAIHLLEKLHKKTKSTWDDDLLKMARKAWKMPDEKKSKNKS